MDVYGSEEIFKLYGINAEEAKQLAGTNVSHFLYITKDDLEGEVTPENVETFLRMHGFPIDSVDESHKPLILDRLSENLHSDRVVATSFKIIQDGQESTVSVLQLLGKEATQAQVLAGMGAVHPAALEGMEFGTPAEARNALMKHETRHISQHVQGTFDLNGPVSQAEDLADETESDMAALAGKSEVFREGVEDLRAIGAGFPFTNINHATSALVDLAHQNEPPDLQEALAMRTAVDYVRQATLYDLSKQMNCSKPEANLYVLHYPTAYVDALRELVKNGILDDNPDAKSVAQEFLTAVDRRLKDGELRLEDQGLQDVIDRFHENGIEEDACTPPQNENKDAPKLNEGDETTPQVPPASPPPLLK